MGWAAAADGLQPGALVLAGLLYCWQLPHFMSLAWMHREDYARGGFRMLPIMDATGRRVANVALRNSLALLPLSAGSRRGSPVESSAHPTPGWPRKGMQMQMWRQQRCCLLHHSVHGCPFYLSGCCLRALC